MIKWTLLLSFILTSQLGFAQSRCSALFRDKSFSQSAEQRILSFESTVASLRKLKPKDILATEFLTELENKIGPVTMFVEDLKLKNTGSKVDGTRFSRAVKATVKAMDQSVMTFTLYFDEKSNYLTVDGLEVKNPLDIEKAGLHMNQESKGVSLAVFNQAQKMVVDKIREQGWDGVICAGTTHYLVAMLYQRSMKMRPTERSKPYYDYLSSIRKSFASSELFYESVGSIMPNMPLTLIENKWRNMKESNWESAGFKPIYMGTQLIAMAYKGKTYIVDPFEPQKTFLHWSKLFSKGQTELILEF